MVICDATTAVNLLAGALVDGVCCLPHSLSNEEEKKRRGGRDDLGRAAVGVEHERQRLFDRECRERLEENNLLAGRIKEEEERRRRSMRGSPTSLGSGGTLPLHHFDASSEQQRQRDHEAVRLSRTSSAASSSKSCRTADERRRMLMEQKLRLKVGGALASAAATRHPRTIAAFAGDDGSICSGMASLLDTSESSDEEETEDDGVFERIDLGGDETYESSPRTSRGRARAEYL